jgi:recombination protein RecA
MQQQPHAVATLQEYEQRQSQIAEAAQAVPSPWSSAALAGRLVELRSLRDSATLSFCTSLIRQAQQEQEPVAWIATPGSRFFPPDLDAAGVDLQALPLVCTNNAAASARAADRLLRCGAFSLIVADLGKDNRIPTPLLSRLSGLVRKHNAALLFLVANSRQHESLSPLISLAATTERRRAAANDFRCTLTALKDKRRGPGWSHEEHFCGPPGLR